MGTKKPTPSQIFKKSVSRPGFHFLKLFRLQCKKRKSWNISTLIFFPDAICSKQKTSVHGNISGSRETRLKPRLVFDWCVHCRHLDVSNCMAGQQYTWHLDYHSSLWRIKNSVYFDLISQIIWGLTGKLLERKQKYNLLLSWAKSRNITQ